MSPFLLVMSSAVFLKQCSKELIQCKKRKQTKHSNWSMIKETQRWPIKYFAFKSSARPGWRNWWRNFSLIAWYSTRAFLLLNHLKNFSCILLISNHMIFLVQFGISKNPNCTHPTGSCNFVSLKNLLVLIYSKLHSKSCDYLYQNMAASLLALTKCQGPLVKRYQNQ